MSQHTPANSDKANAPSTGNATGDGTNPNVGEDVMKVLADVEGQLSRLRTVQKQQDETITSLSERTKAVRRAEEAVEQSQRDLRSQQDALQRDREALAKERESHRARCQEHDQQQRAERVKLDELRYKNEQDQAAASGQLAEIHRKQSELEQSQRSFEESKQQHDANLARREQELAAQSKDLIRRESELKAEQSRVAALATQCQTEREQLGKRTQQIEADRTELLHRVTQAETNVGELIQEVEAGQQQLAGKTHELEQAGEEIATLRRRAQELETGLKEATKRAASLEKDSAELAQLADRERNDLSKQLAATAEQLKKAQHARDAAASEAGDLRGRCDGLETNLQEALAQLEERNQRLADSHQKLEHAGRKLSEFAQILTEQTPQLERGAAAIAMVEQQQGQLDELMKKLAESRLTSDPEEMQRRDQRIEQLTEALRQARGQNADSVGVAEVEQRNAQLEAELSQWRLEAQNATLAAEQAKKQLAEAVSSQATQSVQDASLAEHAAKVAALTAEIQRLHAQAHADVQAQLEAQTQKHRQAMDAAQHAEQQSIAALRERIAELEADLKQAAKATGKKGKAEDELAAQKLRKKAEQITIVADHLRRRKSRLRKLRSLIKDREVAASVNPAAPNEMRAELIQKLELERSHLAEVRQALAASESVLIRKWARPKAVTTLACLMLLAVVCGGVSWLATDHFFPARISASVALEAKTTDHTKLGTEAAEAWRTWHTQLLADESFRQALAKRMAERRLEPFADTGRLAQRMQNDLTVDAADDGMLVMTMAGDDAEEITAFLDVLASTVITESGRHVSDRTDNSAAIAMNERREDGRVRYSTVNDVAIKDDRLMHMLPIFGGLFAITLVFIFVVYAQLLRAKRLFDQDNGTLFADAKINMGS